eukprot:g3901.t1
MEAAAKENVLGEGAAVVKGVRDQSVQESSAEQDEDAVVVSASDEVSHLQPGATAVSGTAAVGGDKLATHEGGESYSGERESETEREDEESKMWELEAAMIAAEVERLDREAMEAAAKENVLGEGAAVVKGVRDQSVQESSAEQDEDAVVVSASDEVSHLQPGATAVSGTAAVGGDKLATHEGGDSYSDSYSGERESESETEDEESKMWELEAAMIAA